MTVCTNTVTALRRSVAKIDGTQERLAAQRSQARLKFGIDEIDTLLGGGFALGDMHELRCSLSRDIGCAAGFVLGLLSSLNNEGPVIWIGEPASNLDTGNLFPDGLMHFAFDASRLVHVRPLHLTDCIWAAGEAARAGGTAAVILHLKDNPNMFDLSVSRKLMLRAQTSGTSLFILRQAGEEEASSATTRWHIKPAPSLPDKLYHKGVGHMRLTLTLEKNRNGQTGQWLIAWNPKTRSFEHAAQQTSSAHSLLPLHPPLNRPNSASKMGQVVALERAS